MPTGMNIIIFLVITSILFQTAGVAAGLNTKSILASIISGDGDELSNFPIYNTILSQLPILAGILTAAALGVSLLLTGTFSFPNPFMIFAGITTALIGAFALLPYNLFSNENALLPAPLNYIVIGLFSFLIIMSLMMWFKGTGEF